MGAMMKRFLILSALSLFLSLSQAMAADMICDGSISVQEGIQSMEPGAAPVPSTLYRLVVSIDGADSATPKLNASLTSTPTGGITTVTPLVSIKAGTAGARLVHSNDGAVLYAANGRWVANIDVKTAREFAGQSKLFMLPVNTLNLGSAPEGLSSLSTLFCVSF
jgi:hypothetical protein